MVITFILVAYNKDTSKTITNTVDIDTDVYCDKNKNVEYLVFKENESGSMTIRRNSDGSVATCGTAK